MASRPAPSPSSTTAWRASCASPSPTTASRSTWAATRWCAGGVEAGGLGGLVGGWRRQAAGTAAPPREQQRAHSSPRCAVRFPPSPLPLPPHWSPALPPAHLQVSMNGMMEMVMGFDGMKKGIKHIPGPEGVRGEQPLGDLLFVRSFVPYLTALQQAVGAAAAAAAGAAPAAPAAATPAVHARSCPPCRPQQRQQADSGEAGLGAHHQAGGWAARHVSAGRGGAAQWGGGQGEGGGARTRAAAVHEAPYPPFKSLPACLPG